MFSETQALYGYFFQNGYNDTYRIHPVKQLNQTKLSIMKLIQILLAIAILSVTLPCC
jgi:hypothetical protein